MIALGALVLGTLGSVHYPGIGYWFYRDQEVPAANYTVNGVTHFNWSRAPGPVPYLDFPFEIPFLSGMVHWAADVYARLPAFNAAVPHLSRPLVAATELSGLLMAICLAVTVMLYFVMGVNPAKVALYFALLPAVVLQADVSTELLQVVLFVGALLAMQPGQFLQWKRTRDGADALPPAPREGLAAVLLALSTLTKLLPILVFPAFLLAAKKRARFALLYSVPLALGFGFQLFANWHNTLEALRFYSGYGVEGSWLGLVFQHSVIDYSSGATWILPTGPVSVAAVVRHLKPVYFVSLALVLPATAWVTLNRRFTLGQKMLLIFSFELWGLWISPPQFFFNVAAMAPLTLPLSVPFAAGYWAVAFLETEVLYVPLASALGISLGTLGWIGIGAAAQWGLLLLLAWKGPLHIHASVRSRLEGVLKRDVDGS